MFITENELSMIRNSADPQIRGLLAALRERTARNTCDNALVQKSDTQEWWHLVWERISDASFIWRLDRDPKLGEWLHARTLELCALSVDEWIGPWFRNHGEHKVGALETAHVTNAVATAYDLASELFSDDEKETMLAALREKGLVLCKRFTESGSRNNWYCVLLSGYATAAAILGEQDEVERAVRIYNDTCVGFYDRDGYGETLQYGNYASLTLSHLREVLIRYNPALAGRLPLTPIANTVKWAISSHLYMKPLEEGGKAYPRSANFGDCAAIFRPTGDVLLQIAAEYEDKIVAGLARWLFDRTYADPTLGPDELATFGFFNQFGYRSLIYLLRAEKPLSPTEAGMPLLNVYRTGVTALRDSWENPKTILVAETGYETHTVDSHRHRDQNSFILAHRNERFFADPGHCCYRLETWTKSCTSAYHSTWDFEDEKGNRYTQIPVRKNQPPINRNISYKTDIPGVEIIASDCADAYGEHFRRCERVFVCKMPNVVFIIDRIESDIPVRMCSHFVVNNRDNKLNVHKADDHRLVLRRGDAGVKFFTFGELRLSTRWGFIHNYYHPLPNQAGQGKEGSSVIYDYTSDYNENHLNIHVIALDETNAIKGWHIKNNEGKITVFSPGNKETLSLAIDTSNENWFRLEP